MDDVLHVESRDAVTVVRMRAGENRFNPVMLDALDAALGAVESADGPRALVLTGDGKFFSNGLDLEWMQGAAEGEVPRCLERVHALYARLLAFPAFTVAAVNGHAFAGGGMLALACDERVMRSDRGYFCLPEVDLGLPFTAGMSALVAARLTPQAAHAAMITAARLGGEEAAARGIVDAAVGEDAVVETAVERAAAQAGRAGATVAAIKRGLYAEALGKLEALARPGAGGGGLSDLVDRPPG